MEYREDIMDGPHVPELGHKKEMDKARQEVAQYAEKEKTGEIKTAHFFSQWDTEGEFDVNTLTEEDLAMWRKVRTNELTEDEWSLYNKQFLNESTGRDRDDIPHSRILFMQFIRNKAMIIFLGRKVVID